MAKYRCPGCGGEKVQVLAQCWATVTQLDSQTITTTYVPGAIPSWDESSRMKCSNCDLEAEVYDFFDIRAITPEQVRRFLGALVQLYQTHWLMLARDDRRYDHFVVRPYDPRREKDIRAAEFLGILAARDEAGNELELPAGCSVRDYEDEAEAEYCDECGAKIPDDAEGMINSYHEKSCSCYPDNGT